MGAGRVDTSTRQLATILRAAASDRAVDEDISLATGWLAAAIADVLDAAADRVEQAEASVLRLETEFSRIDGKTVDSTNVARMFWKHRAVTAEARVAALEDALRRIAESDASTLKRGKELTDRGNPLLYVTTPYEWARSIARAAVVTPAEEPE